MQTRQMSSRWREKPRVESSRCSYLGGHTHSGCVKFSRTYTALQTWNDTERQSRNGRDRRGTHLLDGTLGQEVGLLVVRVVVVLGRRDAGLQRERKDLEWLRMARSKGDQLPPANNHESAAEQRLLRFRTQIISRGAFSPDKLIVRAGGAELTQFAF